MKIAKHQIEKIILEEYNTYIKEIIEKEINKDSLDEGWRDYLAKIFATAAVAGGLSGDMQKKYDKLDAKPKMDVLADIGPEYGKTDYDPTETNVEKKMEYINQIKSLETSEEGKKAIKDHEKLRLKAYTLGDKMVTVGWGHAEPIRRSKFKKGQEISREKAEELFKKDINTAEKGVKRILLKWHKEDGIKIPITQSMFDAMVSMAFNMGVTGLKNTDFMNQLKQTQDPKQAAEKIKTARIGKWKGLIPRRQQEYKMFTAGLDKIV
ncbi:MAG: lysozyme [bacterium]